MSSAAARAGRSGCVGQRPRGAVHPVLQAGDRSGCKQSAAGSRSCGVLRLSSRTRPARVGCRPSRGGAGHQRRRAGPPGSSSTMQLGFLGDQPPGRGRAGRCRRRLTARPTGPPAAPGCGRPQPPEGKQQGVAARTVDPMRIVEGRSPAAIPRRRPRAGERGGADREPFWPCRAAAPARSPARRLRLGIWPGIDSAAGSAPAATRTVSAPPTRRRGPAAAHARRLPAACRAAPSCRSRLADEGRASRSCPTGPARERARFPPLRPDRPAWRDCKHLGPGRTGRAED